MDAVAASIREFGFNSPILIDADGTIINGHTRWKAAKKLGLEAVPVIRAESLSEEQIRKYRLIDNKTSEYAEWDGGLLAQELQAVDLSGMDFDFDFGGDLLKRDAWGKGPEKLCAFEDARTARKCPGGRYLACWKTGDTGEPLTEIKRQEYVTKAAQAAVALLRETLGGNLRSCGWAIVTAPKRRHAEGFHFATEVCRQIAAETGITFCEDALTCANRHRIGSVFALAKPPKEKNVILYDDVITTGETIRASKKALEDAGKTVFTIVSVDNH